MNTRINQVGKIVMFFLLAAVLTSPNFSNAESGAITLVENGKTNYKIVSDQEQNVEVSVAVKELTEYLEKATKANFNSVTISKAQRLSRRIIVGDNVLARSILGDAMVSSLKSDESLVTVRGNDLILVGGSIRGTIYAVYSFLENELGCRWYTPFGDVVVPKHDRLIVSEINCREKPAFAYSYIYTRGLEDTCSFYFHNRQSESGYTYGDIKIDSPDESYNIGPGCHTLFFYIPIKEHSAQWQGHLRPEWDNFFKTNPEFFSMDTNGKRVSNLQLCFSNPELRKTLTRQVESVIEKSGREKGWVSVDAHDTPGHFCHCPDCKKLEEKYGCIGGPIFDYCIELCNYLKEKRPGICVRTLAYRKKQSEVPPKIDKMPDNFIVCFAPIDDNFAATMDHPTNKETLDNLKGWCAIAKNVWVWYYTNPFGCGPYGWGTPPFGDVEKTVTNLRIMHKIGVIGIFFQQASAPRGLNFADLELWLVLKLCQDPNQDIEKQIKEFMDYYFGKAAPQMKKYMEELETSRKQMTSTLPWNTDLVNYLYLTPERIVRWQKMFDKMEQLTADSPAQLLQVRRVRISLDLAMLGKWREIEKKYLDLKLTPDELADRIRANFTASMKRGRFMDLVSKMEQELVPMLIKAKVDPKPLPEFFNQFPADSIKDMLQVHGPNDADAACGVALVRDYDKDLPIEFGFYDDQAKKMGIKRVLKSEEIKPDRYEIYKLDRVTITPNCRVWMTTSWIFTVLLNEAYVEGNPFIEWDVYMSLKFEGPRYGSKDKTKPNTISCDRVILVRQ